MQSTLSKLTPLGSALNMGLKTRVCLTVQRVKGLLLRQCTVSNKQRENSWIRPVFTWLLAGGQQIVFSTCPSSELFSGRFCSCLRRMFITVLNITSVVLSVPKRMVGISANHIKRRNSNEPIKSAVEKHGKTGKRWDLLLVEASGGKFSAIKSKSVSVQS